MKIHLQAVHSSLASFARVTKAQTRVKIRKGKAVKEKNCKKEKKEKKELKRSRVITPREEWE